MVLYESIISSFFKKTSFYIINSHLFSLLIPWELYAHIFRCSMIVSVTVAGLQKEGLAVVSRRLY